MKIGPGSELAAGPRAGHKAHAREVQMSRSRVGFEQAGRLIAALAVGIALACGPAPASAADRRSSPEDRQRFVTIAHSLEQAPLKERLKADREWALAWLTDAPDVTATLCAEPLGNLAQSKYRYDAEIIIQDAFSMAAFMIEHPQAAKDPAAQQLAGVEGALNAYRAILSDKPDARSPALDTLLQTQARGELPAFVRKAWIACSKKKSEAVSAP
jgi:hypothetical protein